MTHLKRVISWSDVDHTPIVIWLKKEKNDNNKIHPMKIYIVF